MIRKLLSNEFGKISTIVMYKYNDSSSKFHYLFTNPGSPRSDLIDNYTASSVLYHGSTKSMDNVDFSEYKFKYLLEGKKYNNKNLVSFLSKNTRDLVGINVEDLDKVVNNMFPTAVNETISTQFGYFGTLTTAIKTLYLIDIDEGYYMIEFYEDAIDSNNTYDSNPSHKFLSYEYGEAICSEAALDVKTTWTKPVMVLYFGPRAETMYNSTEWYYNNDINLATIQKGTYPDDWDDFDLNKSYDKNNLKQRNYSKLLDERLRRKILTIEMTSAGDVTNSKKIESIDLNLSYDSWYNNEDANRNKKDFNLRNDNYWGMRDNFDILYKIPNSEISKDSRSGSLFATTRLSPYQYPILSRKKKSVSNNIINNGVEDINYYSPKTIYRKSDVVVYGKSDQKGTDDLFWISLSDNNVGNNPYTSPNWILKDCSVNFYTDRVKVLSSATVNGEEEVGNYAIIIPGGLLNINHNSDVVFKIYPKKGYKYGSTSTSNLLYYYDNTNTIVSIPYDSGKVTFTKKDNYTEVHINKDSLLLGKSSKNIWDLLLESNRKIIIFHLSVKEDNASVIINLNNIDNTSTLFSKNFVELYVGGVKQTDITNIKAKLNSDIKIKADNTEDYKFENVSVTYTPDNSTDIITEDLVDTEGNQTFIRKIDTDSKFVIDYTDMCTVSVSNYNGFEVSSSSERIEKNREYSLKFYPTQSNIFKNLTMTIKLFTGSEIKVSLDKDSFGIPGEFTVGTKTIQYCLVNSGKYYSLDFGNSAQGLFGCDIDIVLEKE